MTDETLETLRTLPAWLKTQIIGQDQAIDAVAERLQHGELGLTSPGRPKASFLFLGPTGVGKTELSHQFTLRLLGPGKLVRLDMSEYQQPERVPLLLERIRAGFDAAGGIGTLLFDEIEKAHRHVLDILLQLLDAARLTTGENRVLDFTPWYVVLTSNLGTQRIMALRRSKYETMERLVRQDAQRELRPEIFARVTASVVFDRLNYDTQCRIAAAMVRNEVSGQVARHGFQLAADTQIVDTVIQQGYHDRLGARPMRDATERLVRNALAADLLAGGNGMGRLLPDPAGRQLRLRSGA